MFDTLVVTILTYCSETWGISLNFEDDDHFEKLQVKFLT